LGLLLHLSRKYAMGPGRLREMLAREGWSPRVLKRVPPGYSVAPRIRHGGFGGPRRGRPLPWGSK
jgi:hypothetical protein